MRRDPASTKAVLERILESRHAVRTNPEKARADCPPADDERAEDIEISEYILKRRTLYQRTLHNGGPAIAERNQ